jgi:hypothetical protein
MSIILRYSFILLFFCLLVQPRFFHRPLVLSDEFMAMIESIVNDNHHQTDLYPYDKKSDYDRKTLNMNFQSNIHLPRYLRDLD